MGPIRTSTSDVINQGTEVFNLVETNARIEGTFCARYCSN